MSNVGVIARGVKAPIIKKGDDLVKIVCDSVLAAGESDNFGLNDRDVVAVTEAVVARAQGNYATLAQIAKDVREKTGGGAVGLIFPILSRNRFSIILKAISAGVKKLYIQLSYPSDEMGNPLIPLELIEEKGVNPYSDSYTEQEFYSVFGRVAHPFTGIDYIKLYKEIGGDNCEIIISNNIGKILEKTKVVINADVHTRARTKSKLLQKGATTVFSLDEFLTQSVDGSGYSSYGLLGSNLATDESVKLFPRDGQEFVDALSAEFSKRTGKRIEAMIYGDGAFKDPVAGIWELADPMVSPAYTAWLTGTPNELKIKYIADNQFAGLSGERLTAAIKETLRNKQYKPGDPSSQGTTPRRITDLLGSLCDLTSGSGDKGTPIVLIQNYFKNYSD